MTQTETSSKPKAIVLEASDRPISKTYVVLADAQHYEIRRISMRDWAKAGVADAPEIVWSPTNRFRVEKDKLTAFLSEEQYANLILADARLEERTEEA